MTKAEREKAEEKIRSFVEIFRRGNLKITPQRLEIFREIASSTDHPSAEDIHRKILKKMPTVSHDTVYRTLSTLLENRAISRVEVLDESGRYDINLEAHHHLVCVRCKKVKDIYWPEFDSLKIPSGNENWGSISQIHAELRGVCSDCLKKEGFFAESCG